MPPKVHERKNTFAPATPGKSSERRRGRRMNSRVPVRLEWDEVSGKRSSAEAHTRIINPYGCMVVLAHALGLEQRGHYRLERPIAARRMGIRRRTAGARNGLLGTRTVKPPQPGARPGMP